MTADREKHVGRIAAELADEVVRRNEWYGLDNWTTEEVVRFVLSRLPDSDSDVPEEDIPL